MNWSTLTLEQVLGALGLGGLGAVLVALINRFRTPAERRALLAAARRDEASGGADIIAATASAFSEVTTALREEIERLQADGARHQAALQAALDRVVELEAIVARLNADLDRVRRERDEARSLAEMLRGELAQLKQVMVSAGRTEGRA